MNAKKLTVLFFILTSTLIAQQKENYFPHTVGNTWQFKYNDGRIFKEVFVRDSLLEDSSKLLLFLGPLQKWNTDLNWTYRVTKNQDSIIQWPNDINILLYKFPIKPGDKWILWDSLNQRGIMGHCWGEFDADIFGVITKGFNIDYYDKHEIDDTSTTFHTWLWRENIADGFGKIWWGDEVEYYQLMGCIIDGVKYGSISGVENNPSDNKHVEYALYQNYPNPFNSTTRISFYLQKSEYIQLVVYNSLGQIVRILLEDFILGGTHTVNFDASNYPSGIYYYRFIFTNSSITKKMIYLK